MRRILTIAAGLGAFAFLVAMLWLWTESGSPAHCAGSPSHNAVHCPTTTTTTIPPALSINNVTVGEDAGTATFTVTLSAASSQTVTVDYVTANGSASAGFDYTSTSGTLTFTPGDTSEPIVVSVLQDFLDESNETFTVSLSAPSHATIADGQGIGTITITDDDPTLPATQAYPTSGLNSSGGYTIIARNAGTGVQWWTANYWGVDSIPYTADVTWLDGDRSGYKCAYGFLEFQGEIVGRFTFTRPLAAATYSAVNDSYMSDGQRHYDGTPAVPPGGELGECPDPSEEYSSYTGADERPRIGFWSADFADVLDIRDYTNTVVSTVEPVKFRLFSVSATRITVIAYLVSSDLPVMVVYYDTMGTGRISAEPD